MDATGEFSIAIPACKFEIQSYRNFHNTLPITNSKLPYAASLVGLLLRPMRDHANDLLHMVGKKNPDTLVLPTLAALCSEFCHKAQ